MRLLLDQNLSHRLVPSLSDVFPGSVHVRDVGLAQANDESIWAYAAAHDLAIVSKDSDFRQRSFLRGAPPKVVWIRRWYENKRGATAARKTLRDIRSQLLNLARHPDIGHIQEDLASPEHLF